VLVWAATWSACDGGTTSNRNAHRKARWLSPVVDQRMRGQLSRNSAAANGWSCKIPGGQKHWRTCTVLPGTGS
jgi:hypothetical protein